AGCHNQWGINGRHWCICLVDYPVASAREPTDQAAGEQKYDAEIHTRVKRPTIPLSRPTAPRKGGSRFHPATTPSRNRFHTARLFRQNSTAFRYFWRRLNF